MVIDPTTNVGKLRLRLGDWQDIEWLPDSVYEQTLTDCSDNLSRATALLGQYILAILTRSTRSRLAQIESYDHQAYEQYKDFIVLTITNPAFMPYSPIPFGGNADDVNPLIQFQKSWNAGYINGTSDAEMFSYWQTTPQAAADSL